MLLKNGFHLPQNTLYISNIKYVNVAIVKTYLPQHILHNFLKIPIFSKKKKQPKETAF
jgi:hypothetical protein